MDTMMALRAHTQGGPEQLSYEPAPIPHPRSGEVLVAVHAAAIKVYGLIDFDHDGAAAEFATVPAAALAVKPRKVSHVEAAALPLAAPTAWQALVATELTANSESVRRLGAGRFIDSTTEEFDRTTPGLDVVFDTVGGGTLQPSYGVLRRGGRLTFPLAEGRRAYESGGQTRRPGKTVLVDPSSG